MSICDDAQRLFHVAGIHLVRAPVAELRRRAGRVAERSVEARTVLRRIRHDAGAVEALVVERLPDRADAPVHHVGRRHEVGAGFRVRQGRLDQPRHGRVVDHVLAVQDAAVAVRGVFAQAHVGQHQQARHAALDRPHGGLHRRARIRRLRADRVLVLGQAEQQHAGDAQFLRRRRLLDRLVHRQLEDPRHRADRPADVAAFAHEHGIDQAVRRQPRLAHQRPDRLLTIAGGAGVSTAPGVTAVLD